jgi:3-oxoadipate enol-lactonase
MVEDATAVQSCYRIAMVQQGIARSGDVELAYSVRGRGDRALLLIMGLAGRAAEWGDTLVGALAADHRVITFDNRGTGASTKAPGPYTLEGMADDAVAVLDALSIARADVLGLSMGGMIAQLIALDHPERVRRLVLLSTHAGGPTVVPPTEAVTEIMTAVASPRTSLREVVRARLAAITAPGFATKYPDRIEALATLALVQPTPMPAFLAQYQAILDSDRLARLGDIDVPTLVVHGDSDALIPLPNGTLIADRIPAAQLVVLSRCGHLATWECPDELAGVVLHFLDGV